MRRLLAIAIVLVACGAPVDAPDGGAALDAEGVDASGRDAGCREIPGVLTGVRELRHRRLLPDLRFATSEGEFSLASLHRPCADDAAVIVIRSMPAWSASAQWQAAHTAQLRAHAPDQVRLVDLLVLDRDDQPAAIDDLTAFSAHYDERPDVLAADPVYTFLSFGIAGVHPPIVVIVDARTLRSERVLIGPRAGEIEHSIDTVLARLSGTTEPSPFAPELYDERFSADQWDLVRAMTPLGAPPADPTNTHADDPRAAALGARFFADVEMSPSGTIACATCHDAERAFTDGRSLAIGVEGLQGTRNTPSVQYAAHARWQRWDGAADSLWAQALGPVESPVEMASSRLHVAHRIATSERAAYEAIFGAMPEVSAWPAEGAPGDPAFDAMSAADQQSVNRVFANFGKAIAAFERALAPRENALDRYAAGDIDALTPLERDGLRDFFTFGCIECHSGPRLTNDSFHGVLMPGAGTGASADLGRFAAIEMLQASMFRAQGPFSDAPSTPDPIAGAIAADFMRGQVRTPSLRGVADTAPYGHAGTLVDLRAVVEHYARSRMPRTDEREVGERDPHVLAFDPIPGRVDPLTALLLRL